MVAMADALVGSTLIPRLWTKKPKGTFKGVHLEFVKSTSVKHSSQDSKMILLFLELHHNVIHIIFNFFVHHIMDMAVIVLWCTEGSFFSIFGGHADLIVATKPVHEGKHGMTGG